jgi:hypothetical protein
MVRRLILLMTLLRPVGVVSFGLVHSIALQTEILFWGFLKRGLV